MMNETEKNFWEVWNNFHPPEAKPIVYRAYYNEEGIVCGYSTEEWPGNYVEIDRETYVCYPDARVVDGVFRPIQKRHLIEKLQPSDSGIACDPQDICVIVNADKPHTKWNTKHNEID